MMKNKEKPGTPPASLSRRRSEQLRGLRGRKLLIFALISLVGVAGFFYFLYNRGTGSIVIEIEHELAAAKIDIEEDIDEEIYPANLLSGVRCKNHSRRPYAVMLAEDSEARPLSGIGVADLVVEMSVVTDSITRMMVLFVCNDPEELGSVRSARYDFISLAKGYDAILAHWGGEKRALDELDEGVINNLDALPNYFNAFYRKRWIPAPHNGFTSMARMVDAAEKLGYRTTSEFEGYRFTPSYDGVPGRMTGQIQKLTIGYKYPYNIRYEYSSETNSYLRWRAGLKEIDKLTGEQVVAKNIVVMRAHSRQISKDYNEVDIIGRGEAVVYRNGEEVLGTWHKEKEEDVLRFFDEAGGEIEFVPGSIWIEVIEPTTNVKWLNG